MTTKEVIKELEALNTTYEYLDGVRSVLISEAIKKIERGEKKAREARRWKRKWLELKFESKEKN